ncbi:MAG: NAD(P)-binding domain-containing protein, partial [Chitinophagaceae bacterium]|nr:NAD(P)-binding domain-containing protein [Chitinophagaceae bacterium]
MNRKIAILGGGNLGAAIAEGLIQSRFCKAQDITITRRRTELLKKLAQKGVNITSDNKKAVAENQLIILAVKPFQAHEVLREIKKHLRQEAQLVSVVTGLTIHEIKAALGKKIAVYRAMPNTAISIRQSMTCLAHDGASAEQIKFVKNIFDALGQTVIIDEKLMDAATVLGACGTAYAMRYIRASIQGGIEIGFDAATATLISAQTVKGAAELLLPVSYTHLTLPT